MAIVLAHDFAHEIRLAAARTFFGISLAFHNKRAKAVRAFVIVSFHFGISLHFTSYLQPFL
jgi:hypothetical protein